MSIGAAPKIAIPLAPEQKPAADNLAGSAQMAAGGLFLLAVVQVVGGPVAWLVYGASFISALLMLVPGVLCGLLGLVLLTAAGDFKYLGQLPQYSGNHLRNAAKAMAFFHQVLLGFAVLVGVGVLVRMLG